MPRAASSNSRTNNGGEPEYLQLSNEAAMAFHRGEHRLAANLYKESFLLTPGVWARWRYHILHGMVSILKERYFEASPEDFQFLETQIFLVKSEPHVYRVQAAKSLGLLHWDQGRREEAAAFYRDAISFGEKASAKERRKIISTNIDEHSGTLGERTVGSVIDEVVQQAQDNLSVLETKAHPAIPEPVTHTMRSDGTPMPLHYRHTFAGSSAAAEKLGDLLAVGGTQCDCCGKTREELGVTHLESCARCKKAYFCSVACQRKQWKAGHKQACRAPGQVEAGDFVRLDGLQARPELNGMIVKVVGNDPYKVNRCEVEIGNKSLSIAKDKMEQLRPLK